MSRGAPFLAAAFGAYLLYAFVSGRLYFYIHPVYIIPVVVTGMVLLGGGHGARPPDPPGACAPCAPRRGRGLPPGPASWGLDGRAARSRRTPAWANR
jgi:hypothetical protein